MLISYPSSSKYFLLVIFGSAILIGFLHWNHYRSEVFSWELFFRRYLYRLLFLGLLIWNPKGVRLFVLAILTYLLYWDIAFTFFLPISSLPYWYLFRDVYMYIKLPEIFYFLFELGLIGYMLYLTFKWKVRKKETDF